MDQQNHIFHIRVRSGRILAGFNELGEQKRVMPGSYDAALTASFPRVGVSKYALYSVALRIEHADAQSGGPLYVPGHHNELAGFPHDLPIGGMVLVI